MAIAKMTSKGQLTVPKELREKMHWDAGTYLEFTETADGEARIRPVNRGIDSIIGMFKHKAKQPAPTVEEMDEAVAEAFRKGEI